MRRAFLPGCRAALAGLLRRPGYLMMLLLLPLVVVGARVLLPREELTSSLTVGIAIDPRCQRGEELRRLLEERGGGQLEFVFTDRDTLEAMVAAGSWECGFVTAEDFDQRLDQGDFTRLLLQVRSPATTLDNIVAVRVFSALLELCREDIALRYLQRVGIVEGEPTREQLDRLGQILPLDERMNVEARALDGSPLSLGRSAHMDAGAAAALLRGLAAVLLLLCALMTGGELNRWMDSPYARRALPFTSPLSLLLPRLAVLSAAALAAGWLALALGQVEVSPPALLLYAAALAALALLLAVAPGAGEVLPVLFPLVPVVCAVLCPILFDVGQYVPAVLPLSRLLPTTQFLLSAGGNDRSLVWLGVMALIFFAAALLLARLRFSRPRRA